MHLAEWVCDDAVKGLQLAVVWVGLDITRSCKSIFGLGGEGVMSCYPLLDEALIALGIISFRWLWCVATNITYASNGILIVKHG